MGARGLTAGRGCHTIPVPSAPSHLLWTDALSVRPRSLLLFTVDVLIIPSPPPSAAVSASSAHRCLLRRTAVRTSQRWATWSAVRNFTWPLSAAMRCDVMTQDAVQFLEAGWDRSGRANPACLTDRRVTPLSGTPLPSPSNNAGTKVSFSAVSAGPKASPIPGVAR